MRKIKPTFSPSETVILNNFFPSVKQSISSRTSTLANFFFQNQKYFITAISLVSFSIIVLSIVRKRRSRSCLETSSTLFDALDVTPPKQKNKNSSSYLDLAVGKNLSNASPSGKIKQFYQDYKQLFDENEEHFLKLQNAFFQSVDESSSSDCFSKLQNIFSKIPSKSSNPKSLDICFSNLRKSFYVEAEKVEEELETVAGTHAEALQAAIAAKAAVEAEIEELETTAGTHAEALQAGKAALEAEVAHLKLAKAANDAELADFASSSIEKFSRGLNAFFQKMGEIAAPRYTSLIDTSTLQYGSFMTKPEGMPRIARLSDEAVPNLAKRLELTRNIRSFFSNMKDPEGFYFLTFQKKENASGGKERTYTLYEENSKKQIRMLKKFTSPCTLFFQDCVKGYFSQNIERIAACKDVILLTNKVIATGATQKIKAAFSLFTGKKLVKKKTEGKQEFKLIEEVVGMRGHIPFVIPREKTWFEPRFDSTLSEAIEKKKIVDRDVVSIVRDLLHAVNTLHEKEHEFSLPGISVNNVNVFHSDIKLANILFRKLPNGLKQCVLSDISFHSGVSCGTYTATYLAPKPKPRTTNQYSFSPFDHIPPLRWEHSPYRNPWLNRHQEAQRELEKIKGKIVKRGKKGQKQDLWALGLVIASIVFREIPMIFSHPSRMEKWHFADIYVNKIFYKHVNPNTLRQQDKKILQRNLNQIPQSEMNDLLNRVCLLKTQDMDPHLPLLKLFEVIQGLLKVDPTDRISVNRAIEILEA